MERRAENAACDECASVGPLLQVRYEALRGNKRTRSMIREPQIFLNGKPHIKNVLRKKGHSTRNEARLHSGRRRSERGQPCRSNVSLSHKNVNYAQPLTSRMPQGWNETRACISFTASITSRNLFTPSSSRMSNTYHSRGAAYLITFR